MFLADKSADQLREMISRREEKANTLSWPEVGKTMSEIDELRSTLSELTRFTPGTLVLDPETGLAYRRRPHGGYSVFHVDGASGAADTAPENVQVIWTPENEG